MRIFVHINYSDEEIGDHDREKESTRATSWSYILGDGAVEVSSLAYLTLSMM